MNRNKEQNKIEKIKAWYTTNRIKTAGLFFGVVVIVGGSVVAINFFKDQGKVESATVDEISTLSGSIPGWWLAENFGASTCETNDCATDADPDNDRLSNYQEYYYNSNPNKRDTNGNNLSDGEDVAFGYVPNKPGKVTFEDAASDESVVGESLLFNNEVKEAIVDVTDLSRVLLPETADSDLNISLSNSQEHFIDYMLAMDEVARKYYEKDAFATLGEAIQSQNQTAIEELNIMAAKTVFDYKNVPVLPDAMALHKYQIQLWSLIPVVTRIPGTGTALDQLYDEDLNKWYDSVQVMIALNQKIDVEVKKLRLKYQFE